MSHVLKSRCKLLQLLSNQYAEAYSPLVLPKIAKHCLAVKSSSMAIAFVAKVKLYDHTAIKKENLLIRTVKIKFSTLKHFIHNFNTTINQNLHNSFSEPYQQPQLTQRNLPFNIFNRKSLDLNPQSKTSRFHVLQNKILPAQKASWDQALSIHQQLYEFLRILDQRLKDLQNFIHVLKDLNIKTDRFQYFQNQITKLIANANSSISQLLPSDIFYRVSNKQPKNDKFKWLIRKDRNLLTDTGSAKKNILDNLKTTEAPDQNAEKLRKFNFLKRNSNKVQKLINVKVPQKISFNRLKRQLQSTKPQKSFVLNSQNDEKASKNTQQKLSQQLENQYEQKMLSMSCRLIKLKDRKMSVKNFCGQVYLYERKVRSWDNIMGRKKGDDQLGLVDKINNQAHQSIVLQKKIDSPMKENRQSKTLKQKKQSIQFKANRPSQRLNVDNPTERKSQYFDSRSSISSNTASRSTLQGFRNSALKISDENLYDDRKVIAKREERRKRVRMGQMKKQHINFQQQQTKQVSIKQIQETLLVGPQKYVKSRRKGKALPINMNGMFQRILNDQNIQKIIHANRERQQQNMFKDTNNNKKAHQSVLKRVKTGTDTSISTGMNSSLDWAEEYYKNILRTQKPQVEVAFMDKENYKITYSDIIQLQKSLKPIASYNESKMITRYSTEKAQVELQKFQFRYKNNRLVFNHEFYLRQEEEHREGVEEEIKRQKSLREQRSKFDFMNEFKKWLQRTDQPVQRGMDARECQWGEMLECDD